MDFRGNLEFGGSEDIPEADTPCGPTRNPYGNKAISGITTEGQDMDGEYNRVGDIVIDTGRSYNGSMDHNLEVAMIGQGSPTIPHQGGAVTHLKYEGVPLQAAPPGGRGDPNTSATIGDTKRTPGRGEYLSDSTGTKYGAGRRPIGD